MRDVVGVDRHGAADRRRPVRRGRRVDRLPDARWCSRRRPAASASPCPSAPRSASRGDGGRRRTTGCPRPSPPTRSPGVWTMTDAWPIDQAGQRRAHRRGGLGGDGLPRLVHGGLRHAARHRSDGCRPTPTTTPDTDHRIGVHHDRRRSIRAPRRRRSTRGRPTTSFDPGSTTTSFDPARRRRRRPTRARRPRRRRLDPGSTRRRRRSIRARRTSTSVR